jgi:hypothetical protein
MRVTSCLALFLFGLFAIGIEAARAKVVEEDQYTFFAQSSGNASESAQFLVPAFVTADVTIPVNALESCQVVGNPCSGVTLQPDTFISNLGAVDLFRVDSGGLGIGFAFPLGAFQSFGLSFDHSGTALLTVKPISVTVPEPPTSSLLLMGAVVLGFGLWRQAHSQATRLSLPPSA